jgi:octaprenyl-diphosphate synthase
MSFSSEIISSELQVFDARFKDYVKSNVPLLDRIMKYVVRTKGKQLRPMFVLLSARLCGNINESTYRAASLVEILHTASLVHDDVVDESMERRGFFSVYALWKAKISVLVGDYLFAKGLLVSLDHDEFRILQILSRAVKEMSEGELLQMEKSRSLNLDEDVYFRIITHKTASLLAAACAAGAYSASRDEALTEKFRLFGEKVGIAFQIKDDLFDYGKEDVGKPTGNDIKEKKLTLPLIYTLNNVDKSLKKELIYILKNQNRIKEKIDFVIDTVQQSGGIKYATDKMNAYKKDALALLEDFPDAAARETLASLVNYTTDRKK